MYYLLNFKVYVKSLSSYLSLQLTAIPTWSWTSCVLFCYVIVDELQMYFYYKGPDIFIITINIQHFSEQNTDIKIFHISEILKLPGIIKFVKERTYRLR